MLEEFCRISGLSVNLAKSRIFASALVSNSKKARITACTTIQFTNRIEKYLGFPIFSGRQKRLLFQSVVDRVAHKLSYWKSNLLSKVTLVN